MLTSEVATWELLGLLTGLYGASVQLEMTESKTNGDTTMSEQNGACEKDVEMPGQDIVDSVVEKKSDEMSGKSTVDSVEDKNSESNENLMNYRIVRQMEFYFGDVNLSRDKFMSSHIESNEGWFTWEVMKNFKRLSAITTDPGVIITALATSKNDLLEVSEDKSKVRRRLDRPLPSNYKDVIDSAIYRSVYAKSFPLDSTLEKLQEDLEKHGVIDYIQMRKDQKKKFKGSIFIQFRSKEDAELFVSSDIEYNNVKLVKFMKKDYFDLKDNEKKGGRRNESQKNDNAEETEPSTNVSERMSKGAVLHVKGLPEKSNFDDLKLYFGQFGKCAFVDFHSDDTEANVRFEGEGSANAAIEKAKEGEGFKFKDNELEACILEGDDELKYWQKMFDQLARKNKGNKFGKRRFDRKGGPPNKRKK